VQALEAYEQRYTNPTPTAASTTLISPARPTDGVRGTGSRPSTIPPKAIARTAISARGRDGTPPQFTDYGLAALGVPRNTEIPANADPSFYDLGLCGPLRWDFRDRPEYCGMFKSPSLRNVALRRTFFHNGVFHTLKQVLEFYAQRDTNPGKWYRSGSDGTVRKFDDLPSEYHINVNIEPPFDRHIGDKPRLSGQEIDDVIDFLKTLTDGYWGQ
jgi:cytochrome c peroxidase